MKKSRCIRFLKDMFHNLKKQHNSKVAINLKNGDSDRQLTLFDSIHKRNLLD